MNEPIHLTTNTTAADVEGWDSVKHIEIILAAEIKFDIRLSSADLDSIYSVGDLVKIIGKYT